MKFKSDIEIQAGVWAGGSTGSNGQVLSSTGSGVAWINQNAITSASDFVFFNVKNETGSTINKGKGVMAVGTDGNSGHILIDEMVADGSIESKYFLGVLEATVDNGGFARVISFGQLDQFDTRGQNGETWADGQVLWCDPDSAGDFTTTEPDGPNVKIAAAFILNSSTNGKIQVRVQANEGIHDLHDTKITSQVDGDVLVWDNTTGVWFNDSTLNVDYTAGNVGIGTDDPGAKLDVSGDILIDSGEYISWGTVGATSIEGSTVSNKLQFRTNSSDRMIIDASGNVGIGTTSPGVKLQVDGDDIATRATTTAQSVLRLVRDVADATYPSTKDSAVDFMLSRQQTVNNNLPYTRLDIRLAGTTDSSTPTLDVMSLLHNGNVGIGTTSPWAKLDVNGIIRSEDSSEIGTLYLGNTAQSQIPGGAIIGQRSSYSSTGKMEFQVPTWGANTDYGLTTQMTIEVNTSDTKEAIISMIPFGGNVGIGTTDPQGALSVKAAQYRQLDFIESNSLMTIRSTAPDASYNLRGFGVEANTILLKTGATSGTNSTTALTLDASQNAIFTGNVGIGTTDPQKNLTIASAQGDGIQFNYDATSNYRHQILNYWNSNTDSRMDFNIARTSGQAPETIMSVGYNGNVGIGTTSPDHLLDLYKSTSTTGTTLQRLWNYVGSDLNQQKTFIDFVFQDDNTNEYPQVRIGAEVGQNGNSNTQEKEGSGAFVVYTNNATGVGPGSPTGLAERFRVDYAGNVGIGTTDPQSKLQVNGGIQMADDTDTASADKVGTMRYRTATNEPVPVTGTDLVTNGDLAVSTGWNLQNSASINNTTGVATVPGAGSLTSTGGNWSLYQSNVMDPNKTYMLRFQARRDAGPNANMYAGWAYTNQFNQTVTADWVQYEVVFTTTSQTWDELTFGGVTGTTFEVKDITVVEVTEEDASYADMCMQTGASTYEWVNIVRNTY